MPIHVHEGLAYTCTCAHNMAWGTKEITWVHSLRNPLHVYAIHNYHLPRKHTQVHLLLLCVPTSTLVCTHFYCTYVHVHVDDRPHNVLSDFIRRYVRGILIVWSRSSKSHSMLLMRFFSSDAILWTLSGSTSLSSSKHHCEYCC